MPHNGGIFKIFDKLKKNLDKLLSKKFKPNNSSSCQKGICLKYKDARKKIPKPIIINTKILKQRFL